MLKVSVSLMLFGRLFHNIGPITEKALPPYVLWLYRGTTRSLLEEERTLNSILTATGSQWSSLSIGVICSVFRVNDSKPVSFQCFSSVYEKSYTPSERLVRHSSYTKEKHWSLQALTEEMKCNLI